MSFWRGELLKLIAQIKAIPTLGAAIHDATATTTPVDADEFPLASSADAFIVKKVTWANIKATFLAYFNGTAKATPINADRVWMGDSTASNAPVYSTWTQIKAALFGTAATQNTGTSGANVPLLNGINTWSGIQTFSANPSLTGGGLSFPATQVPSAGANVLDDYEEGTFTPAFSATGSTFSHLIQSGTYTKTGRFVQFEIAISLNTSGNTLTANALSITGLPFTANSTAAAQPVRWNASTTSYIAVFARVAGTTVVLESLTAAATGPSSALANGLLHATNGTTLWMVGVYIV
ncbi:hypothetical protein NKJ71_19410 [Mesorhizobium sp. M0050]|uniref:hypothetical protein n=1 Tax=Mesorhizobium sp. M0050 TaxID=2956861 RepID=UPI00333BB76B